MIQKTNKSVYGTSFFNTTFSATPNQLIKLLGEPQFMENEGEDKTNMEWDCELEDGNVFTIYDWKEYRKLKMNEKIEWHVGGINGQITNRAEDEILKGLK